MQCLQADGKTEQGEREIAELRQEELSCCEARAILEAEAMQQAVRHEEEFSSLYESAHASSAQQEEVVLRLRQEEAREREECANLELQLRNMEESSRKQEVKLEAMLAEEQRAAAQAENRRMNKDYQSLRNEEASLWAELKAERESVRELQQDVEARKEAMLAEVNEELLQAMQERQRSQVASLTLEQSHSQIRLLTAELVSVEAEQEALLTDLSTERKDTEEAAKWHERRLSETKLLRTTQEALVEELAAAEAASSLEFEAEVEAARRAQKEASEEARLESAMVKVMTASERCASDLRQSRTRLADVRRVRSDLLAKVCSLATQIEHMEAAVQSQSEDASDGKQPEEASQSGRVSKAKTVLRRLHQDTTQVLHKTLRMLHLVEREVAHSERDGGALTLCGERSKEQHSARWARKQAELVVTQAAALARHLQDFQASEGQGAEASAPESQGAAAPAQDTRCPDPSSKDGDVIDMYLKWFRQQPKKRPTMFSQVNGGGNASVDHRNRPGAPDASPAQPPDAAAGAPEPLPVAEAVDGLLPSFGLPPAAAASDAAAAGDRGPPQAVAERSPAHPEAISGLRLAAAGLYL